MRTFAFAALLLALCALAGCADDSNVQSSDPDDTTTPLPWTPPAGGNGGNATTGTSGTNSTTTTTYPA